MQHQVFISRRLKIIKIFAHSKFVISEPNGMNPINPRVSHFGVKATEVLNFQ